MFNETFWFFYLISVTSSIAVMAVIIFVVAFLIALIVTIGSTLEGDFKSVAPALKRIVLPILICSGLLAIFMPPESAFYGGATQYVAQSTEIDDTLINLKELIDQKIGEQIKGDK